MVGEMTEEERKADIQKRVAVFPKQRDKVLIKFLAMGTIKGLKRSDRREEAKIDAAHRADADKRGLNFTVYREKGDTGFQLFNKEEGVRTTNLIDQLREDGLKPTGAHWEMVLNKGPVTTIEFSREGEEISLAAEVVALLTTRRFNHCTIWCNLNYRKDGKPGQIRVDTINIAKGRITNEPSQELVLEGHTYRLVKQ